VGDNFHRNPETDQITLYEIEPLITRTKRQVTVTVPSSPEVEVADKSQLNKQQSGKKFNPQAGETANPPATHTSIWMNQTRNGKFVASVNPAADSKQTSIQSPSPSGPPLLRNPGNEFINNSGSNGNSADQVGQGTVVPTEEDAYYPPLFPDLSYDIKKDNDTFNNSIVQVISQKAS
jgi:hypothetical protein